MGVAPCTNWNHCGRKIAAPKKPNEMRNVAMMDAEYVRMRHRPSGTMGSLAFHSTRTKSTPTARPMAIRPPTSNVFQSLVCLFVRPMSSDATATMKTPAPRKSRLREASGRFTVGSRCQMTASATMPMGRLT